MRKRLKFKPLVEALVEIKWRLNEAPTSVQPGLHYPLFLGRLQERIKEQYRYVETLPAAHVPDDVTPHIVKYRFRAQENGWPLIQAGPGIATLNFTESYTWDDFLKASMDFFKDLIDSFSFGDGSSPEFTSILLRFINGHEFDFTTYSVVKFMAENLHVYVELPSDITEANEIAGLPHGIQITIRYPLQVPIGTGTIRLGNGLKSGHPAFIWELHVESQSPNVPQSRDEFEKWLEQAHGIIEKWFFSLISGKLESEFVVEEV